MLYPKARHALRMARASDARLAGASSQSGLASSAGAMVIRPSFIIQTMPMAARGR
jgi:hypothetical protein